MEYRIIEKPSFMIVGKAIRVSMKDGDNFRRIPQFWQDMVKDKTYDQLSAIASNGKELQGCMLGVCTEFAEDMSEFTYLIAAEGSADDANAELVEKRIPGATWAAFEAVGALPAAIQAVWQEISTEFLPHNQYEKSGETALEVYPKGNPMQPDYRCEVWIQVSKK